MIVELILYFLLWTLILYALHRAIHIVPILKTIHGNHHAFVNNNKTKWHWSNIFLFNDNWTSTVDLWITEVIPSIIFSWVTGQWWISIFYYVWAAFFQENLEHNPKMKYYPLTFGQWHLIHHRYPKKNFGLFIPIWDRIFLTEANI